MCERVEVMDMDEPLSMGPYFFAKLKPQTTQGRP